MSQTVTLEEAMHYCGFTGETRTSYQKVRFFFHVVRQIAPDFEAFGHYPMDDQIDAPAAEWDAIKDAVKERVRVYRRGGVHQSSDNEVIVETDDEFHYNAKVKKVLAKEEDEGLYIGATRPAFLKDYNVARKAVRVAQFSHRMTRRPLMLQSSIWRSSTCATEAPPDGIRERRFWTGPAICRH